MTKKNEAFILSAKRTPIGSFQGSLSTVSSTALGSAVIKQALQSAKISPEKVDQCIMGQVLTAGCGQAPARQSAKGAGLTDSCSCLTINKVCGSGLKAVMLASQSIELNESEVVLAGGQENMSLSPHLLEKSRLGFRMGHTQLTDSMIKDGLWDPYNQFHMGNAAEMCVQKYHFSREAQDEFAMESYNRALKAQKEKSFENEIIFITVKNRKKEIVVSEDDEPKKAKLDKISYLKPAFDAEGTVTAANASKINDGASAVVVVNEAVAKNTKPLARIVGSAMHAQRPEWFTTAPVEAIRKVCQQTNLSISDIDLFEINEAFSVVAMAAMKECDIPHEKVNIHGGAVALGHPIGASGARILTTLVHALHRKKKKYGLATLCIGGGEAVAMVIEAL